MKSTFFQITANSIRLLTVILPCFGAYFLACQAHKTNGKQFASFIFPSLTFLRKEDEAAAVFLATTDGADEKILISVNLQSEITSGSRA